MGTDLRPDLKNLYAANSISCKVAASLKDLELSVRSCSHLATLFGRAEREDPDGIVDNASGSLYASKDTHKETSPCAELASHSSVNGICDATATRSAETFWATAVPTLANHERGEVISSSAIFNSATSCQQSCKSISCCSLDPYGSDCKKTISSSPKQLRDLSTTLGKENDLSERVHSMLTTAAKYASHNAQTYSNCQIAKFSAQPHALSNSPPYVCHSESIFKPSQRFDQHQGVGFSVFPEARSEPQGEISHPKSSSSKSLPRQPSDPPPGVNVSPRAARSLHAKPAKDPLIPDQECSLRHLALKQIIQDKTVSAISGRSRQARAPPARRAEYQLDARQLCDALNSLKNAINKTSSNKDIRSQFRTPKHGHLLEASSCSIVAAHENSEVNSLHDSARTMPDLTDSSNKLDSRFSSTDTVVEHSESQSAVIPELARVHEARQCSAHYKSVSTQTNFEARYGRTCSNHAPSSCCAQGPRMVTQANVAHQARHNKGKNYEKMPQKIKLGKSKRTSSSAMHSVQPHQPSKQRAQSLGEKQVAGKNSVEVLATAEEEKHSRKSRLNKTIPLDNHAWSVAKCTLFSTENKIKFMADKKYSNRLVCWKIWNRKSKAMIEKLSGENCGHPSQCASPACQKQLWRNSQDQTIQESLKVSCSNIQISGFSSTRVHGRRCHTCGKRILHGYQC